MVFGMVANVRWLTSLLVGTGGFVACQIFSYISSSSILGTLLFLLLTSCFWCKLLHSFLCHCSTLCDLFGLHNSDNLCFFRIFLCFLLQVEVSIKFLDTIHCQLEGAQKNRDYTLGTDFRQEVLKCAGLTFSKACNFILYVGIELCLCCQYILASQKKTLNCVFGC